MATAVDDKARDTMIPCYMHIGRVLFCSADVSVCLCATWQVISNMACSAAVGISAAGGHVIGMVDM